MSTLATTKKASAQCSIRMCVGSGVFAFFYAISKRRRINAAAPMVALCKLQRCDHWDIYEYCRTAHRHIVMPTTAHKLRTLIILIDPETRYEYRMGFGYLVFIWNFFGSTWWPCRALALPHRTNQMNVECNFARVTCNFIGCRQSLAIRRIRCVILQSNHFGKFEFKYLWVCCNRIIMCDLNLFDGQKTWEIPSPVHVYDEWSNLNEVQPLSFIRTKNIANLLARCRPNSFSERK